MLHVLLHMAELEGAVTSEVMAKAMKTNPVVIRRLLAGLRDAGLVTSTRGHGGGWSLAVGLDELTLYDVHEALGSPPVLALGHRSESPECLVEAAVNAALSESFEQAEAQLLERFGEVTLAELAKDVSRRAKKRTRGKQRSKCTT